MLQHVLSLACSGVIISPQFSISCTCYQSASEFISRLPAVFSRHWPAKHVSTSPTTAAWYQTRTDANSALLTLELVSLPLLKRLRNSVTEVFQLLVINFGMVYHLCSGLRSRCLTISNEDLTLICLDWCDEISVPSDYLFLTPYKSSSCLYVCMCLKLWTSKQFSSLLCDTLYTNSTEISRIY